MSDIEIPAFEHGVVRVFTGRFPSEAALKAYAVPEGAAEGAPWPLREELGAEALDPRGVEAFALANLRGMGLPGYLRMAYGVSDAEAARHPVLAEAEGHAVLLASRALGGRAARLRIPERLRYLGAFQDAEAQAAAPAAPALPRAEAAAEGAAAPAEAPRPAREPSPARDPLAGEGPGGRLGRAAGAGAMALGALLVAAGVLGNARLLWALGLLLAVGGAVAAGRARRKAAGARRGRRGG